MGSIATAAKHLIAAGVTGDALVAALEEIETAMALLQQIARAGTETPRTARQERNARYYAKRLNSDADRLDSDGGVLKASESVLKRLNSDAGSLPSSSPSSLPLPPTPPIPITTSPSSSNSPARAKAKAKANGSHDEIDDEFEREFWPNVPRKVAKPAALKAYRGARKRASAEAINSAIKRYSAEHLGEDARFICHPSTWLNQDRWADELALPRGPPDADSEREMARRRIEEHNARVRASRGTG